MKGFWSWDSKVGFPYLKGSQVCCRLGKLELEQSVSWGKEGDLDVCEPGFSEVTQLCNISRELGMNGVFLLSFRDNLNMLSRKHWSCCNCDTFLLKIKLLFFSCLGVWNHLQFLPGPCSSTTEKCLADLPVYICLYDEFSICSRWGKFCNLKKNPFSMT